MRQLVLKLPGGYKEAVLQIVEEFQGKNTIHLEEGQKDVFVVFLPNKKVNDFLKRIDHFEQPELNLIPRGVITLYPPASESPKQVADVQPKSSLEIYLGGIQSVGSYFSLIGYALVSGIIVWIGLFTNTSYLLVAAMLVAPFAGPAMNAALATSAGKADLFKSSVLRYMVSIIMGILASFVLSAIFNVRVLTPLMEEIQQVSKFALFLPLVSGFAGAINICQSERDSLVSGAAVGILVAASLAPPVGLTGIGLFLGEWAVVQSSLFRILLQLFGIHLAATLVFYFYGDVTPDGVRFLKGKRKMGIVTTAVVTLSIAVMLFWQFSTPPFLRKASMNTELTEIFDRELQKFGSVKVLDKSVEFTNEKIGNRSIAKFEATVLLLDTTRTNAELKGAVILHLKKNLDHSFDNIYETYQINVVRD